MRIYCKPIHGFFELPPEDLYCRPLSSPHSTPEKTQLTPLSHIHSYSPIPTYPSKASTRLIHTQDQKLMTTVVSANVMGVSANVVGPRRMLLGSLLMLWGLGECYSMGPRRMFRGRARECYGLLTNVMHECLCINVSV